MICPIRIGASRIASAPFSKIGESACLRATVASNISRQAGLLSRTIFCHASKGKPGANQSFASNVCGSAGLKKCRAEEVHMNPSQQLCQAHSQPCFPNTGRGSEASSSSPASSEMRSSLLRVQRHSLQKSILAPSHSSASSRCWNQPSHSRCLSVAAVIDRDAQLPRLLEGEDAEVGLLVEFRKTNKTGLALITDKDGKRNWKAIDSRGTIHSLRPREIAFVLPGNEYKQDDLHRIQQLAESKAGDNSIMQDAWEIMKGEKDTFLSVTEMADLLFNDTSPSLCYASHRLLNEDRTFFKQVGRLPPKFAARPDAEVQAIKGRQAAELKRAEQRLQEQTARATAFRSAMSTAYGLKPTEAEWLASPWGQEIRALKAYALQEQDPEAPFTFPEALMDVMKPFTGGALRAAAAGELLKQLGVWGLHEHLPLLRAGLTEEFPPSVMAEAAALIASPPPDPDAEHRVDLTHLKSFAIDSADTKEVDDAISLERLEDGVKLWVHIADPTRWLTLGSALEKEAARRALTLYLPTGNVPMFPRQLSEKVFSFQDGQPSLAFSIWMHLGEAGNLTDCGVTCSRVVATRMTYAELNQRLEAAAAADRDMLQLSKVAELRREWRNEQGALTVQFPDSMMLVSNPRSANPTISVKRDDAYETPANLFVSELMIMANEAVGKLGAGKGLPLPYRGQAEMVPLTPEEVSATPEGICRALLVRTKLTRSVMTVAAPLPHHSLGLTAYVQSTSPIRRYSDLLVHWQLKAVLRGEQPPLAPDPLSELVNESSLKAREYKIQDRDITRYWQTIYFQRELQDNPNKLYEAMLATWIKQESGAALAVLSDSHITVRVWLAQPYPLGTKLQLLCAEADPFNAQLTFREASAPEPELANEPGSEQSDAAVETLDADSQLT